jgi:dihydrolipoamide dehydrogenase
MAINGQTNGQTHGQTHGSTDKKYYKYELVVIGGGPAGYAAAIRAGQLGKRVLCLEKENLGGTCLNWGCIPTKALLDAGAFVRKMQHEAGDFGISFDNLKVDFDVPIKRSRGIAQKLNKGIAHLFSKYNVKHELATARVEGPHVVSFEKDGKRQEVQAEHIMIATGASPKSLPGIELDGKKIISSREAMTLGERPGRLAIIGAGAIGCEFADFYNSMGTDVTIVEYLDHLLPNEDKDASVALERAFKKRGIQLMTKSKTTAVKTDGKGVVLTVEPRDGGEAKKVEADLCLLAVGVTGNIDGLFGEKAPVEIEKGHVKVDTAYRTNVESVWAVGDVIGPPWLAHVAHHEAVFCVERMFGHGEHTVDYTTIPGCTYTHPQVASLGLTEEKARESGKEMKVGKFPFSASGRALAAGETDGFVKLIFDKPTGELLGVHMVGENVTELLAELVMARKLEATEAEIIEAMHPHPTLSEAVMEAAGVADGRAIHL